MPGMGERITAASDDVEACTEALKVARQRRDELIVEAIDSEGHPLNEVARWARLARSRVARILAHGL